MTFGDFASRRIIRLYPLATLSVLLGMLKTLGCYLQGRIDGLVNLWAIVVASLLLFPTFWDEKLWPFNLALWSILFEVVASLLFARVAIHLDMRLVALKVYDEPVRCALGPYAAARAARGAVGTSG
jgi:peptidoglycan/LPS O-acetylase OafA/YrhL